MQVQLTPTINMVKLFQLLFQTELRDEVIPYHCGIRESYEPGEFIMIHPKELQNYIRGTRTYLLVRRHTSSVGTIPSDWKAYIRYKDEPRITLYKTTMPPALWVELLERIDADELAPLLEFFSAVGVDASEYETRLNEEDSEEEEPELEDEVWPDSVEEEEE